MLLVTYQRRHVTHHVYTPAVPHSTGMYRSTVWYHHPDAGPRTLWASDVACKKKIDENRKLITLNASKEKFTELKKKWTPVQPAHPLGSENGRSVY